MKKYICKFVNKEMIRYLITGVLTTLVNIIVYYLFNKEWGMENLSANAIAWIISVLFAFVTNNLFVFVSEKGSPKEEVEKLVKFFLARIFSFGIDEAGMFLFINILSFNNLLIKVLMNGIVIVINYILSKWFIFNKADGGELL